MAEFRALAIIPARGGSKRIPRKNIKPFCGKPILAYSVEAALSSNCFSEVMVSTDDKEIADIATALGAKVPFLRSPANSNDFAGTVEVLIEVLNRYQGEGKKFDFVCCIYPTAPFVSAAKLRLGMEILVEKKVDSVLPVMRFGYPIQRSLRIHDGRAEMFWPENYGARSQDLEPAYHDCGQFYCLSVKALYEQKKLFAKNTLPLVIPETEAQDIDNEDDWKMAEIKYSLMQKKTTP